jgi:hypothetical protein
MIRRPCGEMFDSHDPLGSYTASTHMRLKLLIKFEGKR